jgi:hypothetical protein
MANPKENQTKSIIVDGIEYAPVVKANETRAIIVVDRGWIFAGDVTRENGRIKLSRALHVFKWESVGFAGMIENTKKADLRKIADVDIPADAEIFSVPVSESWGL